MLGYPHSRLALLDSAGREKERRATQPAGQALRATR